MSDWFLLLISRYKDRDHLALPWFGLVSAIILAFLTTYALFFVFSPDDIKVRTTFAVVPVVLLTISWYAYRQWYYSSGRGIRVGVSFYGHKIDPEDLSATRHYFAQAFDDMHLHQDIHVKLCPYGMRTKSSVDAFQRRFKLDHLCSIEISAISNSKDRYQYKISHALANKQSAHWIKVVEEIADAILNRPSSTPNSMLDLIKYESGRIADSILLSVTLVEMERKNFGLASKFAYALDQQLSLDIPDSEYPRKFIRDIDMIALMSPSVIRVAELPSDPAVLQRAAQSGEIALSRY